MNSMARPNLRQLADLAQVFGAIGVIISLIYLATEVRQNTKALRSGTFQNMTAQSLQMRSYAINDSAFVHFQLKGAESPDSLTAYERRRWSYYVGAAFRTFENIHYQYASGMLDSELWQGYDRTIRGLVAQPGYERWYRANNDQFSAGFQHYIAGVLSDPRPFGPTFAPLNAQSASRD